MKSNNLIENIKLNIVTIYSNISNVFGIEKEEFKILILNMINSFKYDEELKKNKFSMNVFSIEKLQELKNALISIGLTKEEMNKIIIKSPIIILYSDKLGDIYYLYKNQKYYGYTVLDDKKLHTYLFNDNLDSNIISNNYIVERMLEYYKVNDYAKEAFDNLETEFKLKNYYFKKKHGSVK